MQVCRWNNLVPAALRAAEQAGGVLLKQLGWEELHSWSGCRSKGSQAEMIPAPLQSFLSLAELETQICLVASWQIMGQQNRSLDN